MLIDSSGFLKEGSDNPLNLQDCVGPKGKAMPISTSKKTKVAKLAAAGDIFKSGRAVLRAMGIISGGSMASGVDDASANKWLSPLCFQYLHCLQESFDFRVCLDNIFSVAWDATRLSHKVTLMAAIYDHSLQNAAWMPPMVQFCLGKDGSFAERASNISPFPIEASKSSDRIIILTINKEENTLFHN